MSTIFLFGDYRLDPARRELTREGALQAVEPQVLDLILDLIEHRQRMVTRDELIERIWQGRIVADATLSSRIKSARRAIGDNGRDQALIRTIHGRGFRFVGSVRVVAPAGDDDATASGPPTVQPEAPAEPAPTTGAAEVAPGAVRSSSSLEGGPRERVAERRQLTIVRCSLSDSALALASVDPEELDDFLSRARAILAATFEAFGGHVARTYPAGVLVYFGWPRALEDAAHCAVRAALSVGPALGCLRGTGGPPAEARCGIATGTVVVGGWWRTRLASPAAALRCSPRD